jgi:hypothetical protein
MCGFHAAPAEHLHKGPLFERFTEIISLIDKASPAIQIVQFLLGLNPFCNDLKPQVFSHHYDSVDQHDVVFGAVDIVDE